MAKITHYIGEISGKLGGQIYARNKAGSYVKNFVSPTNPNTVAQASARASFAAQVTSWHALTDAQKTAWNTFASNYFSPKYPGVNVAYSGFNAFVSLNNQLKNIALRAQQGTLTGQTATYTSFPSYIMEAPTLAMGGKIKIGNLGPGGTDLPSGLIFSQCDWDLSDGYVEAKFQTDAPMSASDMPIFEDANTGEEVSILLMASLPGTQTQEFAKGPKYRILGCLPVPTVTNGPASPSSLLQTQITVTGNGLKYGYSEGEAVTLTAFLCGASGQTVLLGSQRVVIV